MKEILKYVMGGVLALLAWKLIFPPMPVPTPIPTIVTVHDTVQKLDTVWITKLKEKYVHDTVNVTERVTVQKTDTFFVAPRVSGVTTLSVGQSVKDTTIASGFTQAPGDSSKTLIKRWVVKYYTPGPLTAMFVDSVPPELHFGRFTNQRCTLGNGGLRYAGGGALAIVLLRAILAH